MLPNHTNHYLTNNLVNKENENHLKSLQNDSNNGNFINRLLTVLTKGSQTDHHTGNHFINIPNDLPISKTGNLPSSLTLCLGAKVMLTDNMDIFD